MTERYTIEGWHCAAGAPAWNGARFTLDDAGLTIEPMSGSAAEPDLIPLGAIVGMDERDGALDGLRNLELRLSNDALVGMQLPNTFVDQLLARLAGPPESPPPIPSPTGPATVGTFSRMTLSWTAVIFLAASVVPGQLLFGRWYSFTWAMWVEIPVIGRISLTWVLILVCAGSAALLLRARSRWWRLPAALGTLLAASTAFDAIRYFVNLGVLIPVGAILLMAAAIAVGGPPWRR